MPNEKNKQEPVPIVSPFFQPSSAGKHIFNAKQLPQKIIGTFEVPVTWKLVRATLLAWILRKNLLHNNVEITHK